MPSMDDADLADHRAALARLDEAGLRLEEARASNSEDVLDAEQAFAEAMRAYMAVREQLADPLSVALDGAPVARVWLGRADAVLGAPGDPQ